MTDKKRSDEPAFTPNDLSVNTAQCMLNRNDIKSLMSKRSDKEGMKQIIFYVLMVISAQLMVYWCIQYQFNRLYYGSIIYYGYIVSFLFHGIHECVHRTAFKTKYYNDAVAGIFGFLCLRPPNHYKYYHWAHHKYTGSIEKDPELQNTFIDIDIKDSLLNYILYISGVLFWIDRITTLLRHSMVFILDEFNVKNITLEEYLLPKKLEYYLQSSRVRYIVTKEAFIFVALYVAILILCYILNINSYLYQYYILPSIIGQMFLRFYLIGEHNGCVTHTNMWLNTRSTNTYYIESKLAWHMNYHMEHHAYPDIPFYLLPKLHDIIKQRLVNKDFYAQSGCKPNGSNGYISINWKIIRHCMEILRKF